ncbi:MAG: UbiA family prenyltransferase [Bacteroidota bacterium]
MIKSTITCDMEGVIETYSDGAQQIFGYASDEVVGKKRVSLFSPGLIVLQNVEGWLKTARERNEYVGETVFVRKDGSQFPAKVRITPTFKDGEQIGYCGVTEPIDHPVNVNIKWTTNLIKWLVITRAPFLTAALMPLFIGGAYAAAMLGEAPFPALNFTLTAIGVALLHLASNVYNDYFDWKDGTDQANASYFLKYSGGSRAIELGLTDLRGTFSIATGLLLTSVAIGVYLTWQVGWGVLLYGLIGATLGFFYTAPPVRLVARHGLGEIAIGLAFGPLITAGTAYAVTGQFDPTWSTFLLGVPVGLLTANILIINQIPDIEADASTGKNHLVVTLGKERTPWLYGGTLVLSTLIHGWMVMSLPMATALWWVPFGMSVVYGAYIIRFMVRNLNRRELVHANVQTVMLNIAYGAVFASIIAFM